jgi:hypothetical protein
MFILKTKRQLIKVGIGSVFDNLSLNNRYFFVCGGGGEGLQFYNTPLALATFSDTHSDSTQLQRAVFYCHCAQGGRGKNWWCNATAHFYAIQGWAYRGQL